MNVFELVGKILLDTGEYESGLTDAEEKTSSFGEKSSEAFGKFAKVTAGAVAVAGGAVAKLTKDAVESYSNYEQLVGGVETLFGAGGQSIEEYAQSVGKTVDEVRGQYENLMSAQSEVFENAKNAYATAGMSANEYMETVSSFSASLIQSLGGDTQKAGEIANVAITDMADNANKMGTSIESIQTAYAGFAKQNYTMLDNLKLGYGGTKSEMERLLADAEKFSGIHYDVSSYADVVDAIHVVQEQMGIAGATANEAKTTIEGSLGMAKASWANLVTGIADENANMGELITQFLDSVMVAGDNLLPRIEQALNGIGQFVSTAVPQLLAKIPPMLQNILPSLLTSAMSMVQSLLAILPEFITGIADMLPELVDTGVQMLMSLADGFANSLPELILVVIDAISSLIDTILDHIDEIIAVGIKLLIALGEGLIKAIPKLVVQIPKIIKSIAKALIDGIGTILDAGKSLGIDLLKGIWNGIKEKIGWLKDKAGEALEGVKDKIKGIFGIHSPSKWGAQMGDFIMQGIGNGIADGVKGTIKTLSTAMDDLKDVGSVDMQSTYTIAPEYEKKTESNESQLLGAIFNAMAMPEQKEHVTIIQLDGKTIAKAVDKPLQDISRQRGLTLAGGEAW